jgi:hypothetical protein
MAKIDKYRKRYEAEKKAKEVMDTPVFKEAIKEQNIKATANAIGRLAFIACEYLENNHGYKKVGLKKFLKYLSECIDYTGEDEDFFLTHEKYYKEIFDLDVLGELGLCLEDK